MGEWLGENVEKVFGNEEFLPKLGTEILDSGGCVQNIAVVGHLASEIADFRGNNGSAVGASLESRGDTIFFLEPPARSF